MPCVESYHGARHLGKEVPESPTMPTAAEAEEVESEHNQAPLNLGPPTMGATHVDDEVASI